MSKLLRQPSQLTWGTGALANTVVNGSNRVVLSGGPTPIASNVFWNKAGSVAQITNSEVGPDGVITGAPTYAAGKFGNGINGLTNANYPTFTGAHPAGVSIFEYWWKPGHSAGDMGQHTTYAASNAGTDIIWVVKFNLTYKLAVFVYEALVNKVQYRYNNIAYTAGNLYHVLVVIDSGAGATNRAKLYLDGVLQVPTSYNADAAFTFGGALNVTLTDPVNARPADSVIDNPKIYNSAADLAAILANRNNEGWPGVYAANGNYQSPVIDCGAGERPFLVGWTRSAYVDDEYIESIRIRGSNDAPTGAATGQANDDDATPHDYWSAPVWSPQNWETLTQDVEPVTHYRYIQFQANLVAATDLEDTPELQTLRMLFRSSEFDAVSKEIRIGERIKAYHLEVGGVDLAGGTSTLKFPTFTMRRGRGAAGLQLSSASFSLENASGAFNVGNPNAWFGGQDVYGMPIDAWIELSALEGSRFDLWKGIGQYVKEDERKKIAILYGKQVHKTFTGYNVTQTDNNVTPAAALQDTLVAAGWIEGVDYNLLSFLNSAQRQQDAAIYINYDYSAVGDSVKLSEFIRTIAMIGCADVFFFRGLLYYRAWTPYVSGLAANLTWFEEAPIADRAMKSFYNDYRIDHSAGSEETDAGNNDIGDASRVKFGQRVFALEETTKLEVVDANAAVGLGDLYIQRDLPHSYGDILTPLANVLCGIDIAYLNTITLDSFVTVTWPREGFDARVFEVMGMTIDSNREILRLRLREAVRA